MAGKIRKPVGIVETFQRAIELLAQPRRLEGGRRIEDRVPWDQQKFAELKADGPEDQAGDHHGKAKGDRILLLGFPASGKGHDGPTAQDRHEGKPSNGAQGLRVPYAVGRCEVPVGNGDEATGDRGDGCDQA